MALITVHIALTSGEAQLISSRLEAAGLHPTLKDELSALATAGQALATGGIKVQVPDDEEDEARMAIDAKSE